MLRQATSPLLVLHQCDCAALKTATASQSIHFIPQTRSSTAPDVIQVFSHLGIIKSRPQTQIT